jgi:hypothetical protein
MEVFHKDPSTPPTIEAKNWPKNFKAINEYFQGLRGCKGHPLSYVFYVNLIPMAHAVDPAPGVFGSTYLSLDNKLIAQGPIIAMDAPVGSNAEMIGPFANVFLVDRAMAWEKLAEILLTSNLFTVIKTAKVRQNGRMAYKLLYAHYLSPNKVNYMAGEADTILAGSAYCSEKHNWTFEEYALLHLKQHQILEGLIPHGYTGIDPGSKVCHLNSGIKTTILDAINSLTAKSVPAGTKLVLFGRYVLNIYVGKVQYIILRKTKTRRAKIYLPTQRTNWQKSYDIN